MSPNLLRQFWGLVETIDPTIPEGLDDNSLIQWLLRQMRSQRFLSREESDVLVNYMSDRLPLIRAIGAAA
jgi:hypothetical protein